MRSETPGVRDVAMQLLDQIVRGRELDVGVQVSHELQLQPLLVEIPFEVERDRLDSQLRAAECRRVPDRERGHDLALGCDGPSGICAESRYELVRLDAYVRGRKTQPPADAIACLDGTRHRVGATEEPVRHLDITRPDQPPDLGAVQVMAVNPERRDDLDVVPVRPQPLRVSGSPSAESEVEPDGPAPDPHRRGKLVDKLL